MDIELSADVDLSTDSPEEHQQRHQEPPAFKGLDPRIVPIVMPQSCPTTNALTAGSYLLIQFPLTPSRGKLWNLRRITARSDDLNFIEYVGGTQFSGDVFIGPQTLAQNGTIPSLAMLNPILSTISGSVLSSGPFVNLSYSRYEMWIRPGQYLYLMVSAAAAAFGGGHMFANAFLDQYDEGLILSRAG